MHATIDEFEMPDPARVDHVAGRLALLADPTRLKIVVALAQGETNPSCLSELTGTGMPAVSQHLAKLRLAGVCRAVRDGQRMVYELVDDEVRDLVVHLLNLDSASVAATAVQA